MIFPNVYKGIIYIFYNKEENSFYDGGSGTIIYDIHNYLTPSQVYLFRKNYAASFETEDGYLVEIIDSGELEDEQYDCYFI